MQGVIRLSDTLLLGPTSLGEFIPVPIRSIQRKRLPVTEVRGGQTASFALKKVYITEPSTRFMKSQRFLYLDQA